MLPTILLWTYCACVAAAALAGSGLPYLVKLTHRRMQLTMSFVGGFMLGVALLHMVPHAVHATGSVDRCLQMCLLGVLLMFLMIRVFHVHSHAHEPGAEEAHDCGHDHAHEHHHHEAQPAGASSFSWLGLAIGLAIHTLIDGIALAAAVQADASHGIEPGAWPLFGIGPFLAVLLHKPLDSLSITSTMMAAGWSRQAQRIVSIAFALMCPAGALLFALGISHFVEQQHWIVGLALAFSGGVFLCISLADLLPEVTFHSHDRVALTAALAVGIFCAYLIGFVEDPHLHHDHGGHGHSHAPANNP